MRNFATAKSAVSGKNGNQTIISNIKALPKAINSAKTPENQIAILADALILIGAYIANLEDGK